MDKEWLLRSLAQAERHVANGQAHIDRQHVLVAKLERSGHDAASAKLLLLAFEQTQRLHIVDRDRFRADLAKLP